MVDVHAASFGLHEPSPSQLRKMMAHGGLAEADRSGEVAVAHLTRIGAEQQRHERDPYRIGQCLESQCNLERSIVVDGTSGHGRATHRGGYIDRGQRLRHADILP